MHFDQGPSIRFVRYAEWFFEFIVSMFLTMIECLYVNASGRSLIQ